MNRFFFAALVALGVCVLSAGAQEPKGAKTGLLVGNTRTGDVVVASVKDGSLSSFMGFNEGDKFLSYSFNGTEKKLKTTNDLSELLEGKPGKYIVVLEKKEKNGGPHTISGSLGVKPDGKTLYFLRDQKK
jgi:hypothetical protein